MKKYLYFIILFVYVLTTGCRRNNNNSAPEADTPGEYR